MNGSNKRASMLKNHAIVVVPLPTRTQMAATRTDAPDHRASTSDEPAQTSFDRRMSLPIFLTVAEVAGLLSVSEKTVRRRIKAKLLHTVALEGRLVRIPATELDRLAVATGNTPRIINTNTINDVIRTYENIPK